MAEFWEQSFREKQEMWGQAPADSAISTAELFQKKGLKEILIPGFGYGRNAKVFTDTGFTVTGIEIAKTAIEIAKSHFGKIFTIHHGSVNQMPFDEKLYDGIFCYALIHLLDDNERTQLIRNCFDQLNAGGYMVFVTISKNTETFGQGVHLGNDRYETKHGVKLFYYDAVSIEREFGDYGLTEAMEVNEPAKNMNNRPGQVFWQVICQKK